MLETTKVSLEINDRLTQSTLILGLSGSVQLVLSLSTRREHGSAEEIIALII